MQGAVCQPPPPCASRIPQGKPRPSATRVAPPESKQDDKSTKCEKKTEKKVIEFQLPPLCIVGKKKEIDFEFIRKKVIRRGCSEGEDKKQLARILRHLKESKIKIRVHEFVNLVAKYTSDNGETMRRVMEEDLASFRKMVTKVYETMTQDVSDVLVNEQIQTQNFYQERYDMFNNKMLWMISEIFQMISEFDFEKYAKDKEDFLNYVCPIPALVQRDAEDIDLQRRQEAFHRLQWLKIEEDRLAEENRRLEERLEYLKEQHRKETTIATMKTTIMEGKMHDLEIQEQEKQERLNELEGLLGKNIVRTEAYIRLEEDEATRMTKTKKVDIKKAQGRIVHKKDEWSKITAVNIEEGAARRLVETESARCDEKKRLRRRERESGRETCLLSEQATADYSDFCSAVQMEEKNIQQTTSTVQERRPKRAKTKGCAGGCT